MIYRSQALGPFPPLTTSQPSIPPLFPPTSAAQPRKPTPGPDTVVQASCKSNLSVDQARLSIYDNSSFSSCMKLVQVLSCNCTANCPHTLQILQLHKDDRPPVWSHTNKALFSSVFSKLSLEGHLAIMDSDSNLFVPILEGARDFIESDHLSPDTRMTGVKTLANCFAHIRAHPLANLSSLLVEPCSASLCDLRFRDIVTIVDFARRQIPNSSPIRLEARLNTPTKNKLSFCKNHPHAPRVCMSCFYQTEATFEFDESLATSSCPQCLKQYFPLNPQLNKPANNVMAFEEPDLSMQSHPSPLSYASTVKNGIIPPNSAAYSSSLSLSPPPQVITKICNVERQMQVNHETQSENTRALFDQLHAHSQTQNSHAERLTQLEDSYSWKEAKHKTCQSTKKVDSNFASIKKLSIELATLTAQVKDMLATPPIPIETTKMTAQISDINKQVFDTHNVLTAQVGNLNKQVTDIQATLYKQLTSTNTLPLPSVEIPSMSANSPPPAPIDPPDDDAVVDI